MDELTTKRLAIIKQLYQLGINQSYDSEPINGFCLLSFHDSIEMFMKLCAESKGIKVARNTNFGDYFKLIPDLLGEVEMSNLNNRRVALKHYGSLPSKLDIEISRVNVSTFFQNNTLVFFNINFDDISLISLVKYDTVKEYLQSALENLNSGENESSIINSHIAFKELLFCYDLKSASKNVKKSGSPVKKEFQGLPDKKIFTCLGEKFHSMFKVSYSTSTINSFGGINFADSLIGNASVYKTIDQMLGNRDVKAQYTYSDLFRSYFLLTLCGGECAEDITEHLRRELSRVKGFDVCSADTLLRMQKELATEKETIVSETNIEHDFNINLPMNRLMIKLLVQTGVLSPEQKDYIFDYDNQFIPAEKYDSKRSYKHAEGYFPGIASINSYPVYIENRNGNSNVKYKQAETLKRAYGVLAEFGIKVKHSRMDCGSFDKTVIPVVEANSTYFYIRAQRCENLYDQIGEISRWETVTIGMKDYEVASIEYAPFGGEKTYRYVIAREKNSDGQGNLFTGDDFTYRAIMTNNEEMSDKEVVEFYNDRGESERLFDEMNNDFLWKKMPFSFLHENTVFLVMMAICRNLYHFLIEFISRKLDFIKPNFRLKKFIFRFMVVPSKWIKQGRGYVLKLFTTKKYHLVFE